MVFGSIAAHDKKAITVFQVYPVIGHCAAPERLSQSRNSWAVSNPGLVVDVDQPQCPDHRIENRNLFVVDVGAAEVRYGFHAVDHLALVVFLDETRVTCFLHTLGDFGDCPVPAFLLPFVAVRGPIQDLGEAVGICRCCLKEGCAFGAQGTLR